MIDVGGVMNMIVQAQKNEVFDVRIIELNSLQVPIILYRYYQMTHTQLLDTCS
jgi:hypothetical protein